VVIYNLYIDMLCKDCIDKIDRDYKGAVGFKCKECGMYCMVVSNYTPCMCEACSDELERCMVCGKYMDKE